MTVEILPVNDEVSTVGSRLESVGETLSRARRLGGDFNPSEIKLIEQQAKYYSELNKAKDWPANPASELDGAKVTVLFRRLGIKL